MGTLGKIDLRVNMSKENLISTIDQMLNYQIINIGVALLLIPVLVMIQVSKYLALVYVIIYFLSLILKGVKYDSDLEIYLKEYHASEYDAYKSSNKLLNMTQQRNYIFLKSKYFVQTEADKEVLAKIKKLQRRYFMNLIVLVLLGFTIILVSV